MEYSLFDVVVLNQDIQDKGLRAGAVGTIIDIYTHPAPAYEVEFCDDCGRTIALLALLPHRLRLPSK